MKRFTLLLGLLLVVAGVLVFIAWPRTLPPGTLPAYEPDLANGERMFHAGGCVSCHASSDNESGLPLLGGGLAMETAFGVFHVPNISPDALHGIGQWAVLDFVNAMKKGVSPGVVITTQLSLIPLMHVWKLRT